MDVFDFDVLVKSPVFVDKTLLINYVLFDAEQSMNIITAPSRFGKSAMISMVKHFLESHVDAAGNITKGDDIPLNHPNFKLFTNLNITQHARAMQKFGQHPVVHLDLLGDDKNTNLEGARKVVRRAIHREYERHQYLISNAEFLRGGKYELNNYQEIFRNWIDEVRYEMIPEEQVTKGLKILVEMLTIHHNQKCVILIDEYDSTINMALGQVTSTELEEISKLVAGTITPLCKGKWRAQYIHGGIVTGVSYLSGCGLSQTVNNITPLRFPKIHDFTKFLALNKDEVSKLFDGDMKKFLDDALTRYNGYLGKGNVALYNPYSVYKCVQDKENCIRLNKIGDHWKVNNIVKGISQAFKIDSVRAKIHQLLGDKSISVEMTDSLHEEDREQLNTFMSVNGNLDSINERIVIGFLAEQGCLVCNDEATKAQSEFPVWIPNQQIKNAFIRELAHHFELFHPIDTKACSDDFMNILKNVTEGGDALNASVSMFLESFNKLLYTMFGHVQSFKEIHLQTALAILCALNKCELDVASNIDNVNAQGNKTYGVSDIWITCKDLNVCVLGELKNHQSVENATEQITEEQHMNLIKQSKVSDSGITHCFVFGLSCTGTRQPGKKNTDRFVTLDILYDARKIPDELKYVDDPKLLKGLDEHEKARIGNVIHNFRSTESNKMKFDKLTSTWKTVEIEP